MNVIKDGFNYAEVYLPNTSRWHEGYLKHWEVSLQGTYITLEFGDGCVVKTGFTNVYLTHKDVKES